VALKTNYKRINDRISSQDFILGFVEYAIFNLEQEEETIRYRIKKVRCEELKIKKLKFFLEDLKNIFF